MKPRLTALEVHGAFNKVTVQPDNSLIVSGVASSETRDRQGDVVLASAMREALPGYLALGGAIREMHAPIAAGRCTEIEVGADGKTYLTAHVVDPSSCAKILARVLRGFSIGGEIPAGGRSQADPSVVEHIAVREISLVDVPANLDAMLAVKADAAPAVESALAHLASFDRADFALASQAEQVESAELLIRRAHSTGGTLRLIP